MQIFKQRFQLRPKIMFNDQNIANVQKSILEVSYFQPNTIFKVYKNEIQTKG